MRYPKLLRKSKLMLSSRANMTNFHKIREIEMSDTAVSPLQQLDIRGRLDAIRREK